MSVNFSTHQEVLNSFTKITWDHLRLLKVAVTNDNYIQTLSVTAGHLESYRMAKALQITKIRQAINSIKVSDNER